MKLMEAIKDYKRTKDEDALYKSLGQKTPKSLAS